MANLELHEEDGFSAVGISSFRNWVAALSMVKIAERPIEAWHSRVTSLVKSAPSGTLPHFSCMLRFEQLVKTVAAMPKAGKGCRQLPGTYSRCPREAT